MIKINDNISIPSHELHFKFVRSSGPGGQNVNKVNSKAELRWHVESSSLPASIKVRFQTLFRNRINADGYAVLTSDTHRDQERNAEECRNKLKAMIAEASFRPKKRKPTKPTKGSVKKRLDSKKQQSEKKNRRKKIDF